MPKTLKVILPSVILALFGLVLVDMKKPETEYFGLSLLVLGASLYFYCIYINFKFWEKL